MSLFRKRRPTQSFSVHPPKYSVLVERLLGAELRQAAHQAVHKLGATPVRIGRSRWTLTVTHQGDAGLMFTLTADVSGLSREDLVTLRRIGEAVCDRSEYLP